MKRALYLFALLAVYVYMQHKDAEQEQYTKGLESVLARCLTNNTGGGVVIGGQIYLCGIYDTGERL